MPTNEFYFLDTSTSANKNRFTRRNVTHRQNGANPGGDEAGLMIDNTPASYNEGFAKRKALLGTSSTVRCEIPLNRYSFFEALEDKLPMQKKTCDHTCDHMCDFMCDHTCDFMCDHTCDFLLEV